MNSRHWFRGTLALLALLAATPLAAQLQTGNLYGTVTDQSASALPGVTVTLSGQGAPQVQVSNAQGQFRFLSLAPGSYDLKGELEGFSTVDYPSIVINVGRNTSIELKLQSAVEETITVTAESPLLDERRISTGATMSKTELEKIPTARDPWVILQTTPGVLTDRINVGGNQSGQQSTYIGPGSPGTQAVWSVDGVVITDMASLSSPAYYDFDSFEEMQVSTGGSDATLATPGVALNMVTKRGTNEWRGSGRYIEADQSWQANSNLDTGDLGHDIPGTPANETQKKFSQGNRIVDVQDYGAEAGGPLWKDRLWIWGAYAENKIDLLTISDFSDKTTLKDKNAKLNAQVTASNSATGFYSNGDKVKLGRGASPTRPQEASWDQDGPTSIYKAEDTQIFGSNFYLTGMYSKIDQVFNLVPEGGADLGPQQTNAALDQNFVWQNTYLLADTVRPQKQYKADSSAFFNTGHLAHELKFGAGYRQAEVTSLSRWPGFGLDLNYYQAFGYPQNVVALSRDVSTHYQYTYKNLYAQDTLTAGNLTANIGLRYDQQTPKNLGSTAVANTVRPDLLPAVHFAGGDPGFEWSSVTPRLGVTYALGADRKTLLRASYSRFADQLGGTLGVVTNPLYGFSYSYLYYDDVNHDGHAEPGELRGSAANAVGNAFSGNVNPFDGGLLVSNAISPHLSAPITDELLGSVEYALRPEFVVGLDLTWRRLNNFVNTQRLVFDSDPYSAQNIGSVGRVNVPSDYVVNLQPVVLPDGSTRMVPVASLSSGVHTRNGLYYYNSDIRQDYKGASLVFNKRLANQWMMRGNFTWSDWTWDIPGHEVVDPTVNLAGGVDGDVIVQGSGTGNGAFGNVFINSKWSYSFNGMYQVKPDRPWGFNVAASLNGRQGYPLLFYVGPLSRGEIAGTANRTVQATRADESRNQSVHTLDLRLEKEFNWSPVGLTLGVDVFNALNDGTVLQRNGRLSVSNTNYVTEILSPRIFRLGARLSFR